MGPWRLIAGAAVLASITACGGGSGGGNSGVPPHTVGGNVSGLTGSGLVLLNNGADPLNVSTNGAFTFSTGLPVGGAFDVTVSAQPSKPTQTCTVAHGSGTISGNDITNVTVTCSTNTYTVGGTISGLVGSGLVLADNGANNAPISKPGPFTLSTPVDSGAQYSVTVATQPTNPPQTCTVSNGSGTVSSSNITNIAVACNSPPAPTTATLLAVTNATSGTIDMLTIDTKTGAPKPIAGDPLPDGPTASAVAIDPQKRFLYVSSTSGEVRGYLIDPSTLNLTPVSGSPFATSAQSVAIAIDPNGHFVLTANGSANTLSVFTIGSTTGTLTEVAGSPFAAGADPSAIVVTASHYVYAVNTAGRSVSAYSMDMTSGALAPVVGSPLHTSGSPNGLVIDPAGTHIYTTESQPNELSGFSIDAISGALTPISGSPFAASYAIRSPVMDAKGQRLHAANGTNVDCFLVDSSTGGLTEIGLSYTNGRAIALALDGPDDFLNVLDNVGNQVEVFAIDPTAGSLTLITGSPFALFPGASSQGLGPNAIAVQH